MIPVGHSSCCIASRGLQDIDFHRLVSYGGEIFLPHGPGLGRVELWYAGLQTITFGMVLNMEHMTTIRCFYMRRV
jgi:hypothetical protein